MNDETHNIIPAFGEGSTLTMSSLEIAELTGKRHDNVMADVRNMLESLAEGSALSFQGCYVGGNGKQLPCFSLPKRECIILVSGYDVGMRARIVDRWLELEASARPDPMRMLSDPVAMRGLLLGYTEKVIELEAKVGELQPKAEAHDRIADSFGTFCRMTAAKNLGVPPHTLTRWMRTNGWTYRRPGDKDDIAYQGKINSGLLEHKVTTGQRPDGSEWTSTQVRITPRGLTVLAKAFPPAATAA